MGWLKRMAWGGAAIIVLCIFAVMLLAWQIGHMKKSACGTVRERREANV